MGRCAHPLNRYVFGLLYIYFLLNSSIVSVTRRVFLVAFSTNTCRTRNHTNVGVVSHSASFFCPTTHAEHEKTPTRVSVRVRHLFFAPRTVAEHEKTPTRVSFRVRRPSFALQHTPNTKPHPCWCGFVFGILSWLYNTCRARKDTNEVSFRARCHSFALQHTEHEMAPSLVPFRVRRHSFALHRRPSLKRHPRWCLFVLGLFPTPCYMTSTKPHQQGCDFVFGVFSSPYHRCANHETTPTSVSFRGWRLPYHLPLMPSTKPHPRGSFLARIPSYPSNEPRGYFIKYFVYY